MLGKKEAAGGSGSRGTQVGEGHVCGEHGWDMDLGDRRHSRAGSSCESWAGPTVCLPGHLLLSQAPDGSPAGFPTLSPQSPRLPEGLIRLIGPGTCRRGAEAPPLGPPSPPPGCHPSHTPTHTKS